MKALENKIKYYRRWRKITFALICATWYFGGLLPLGCLDQGDIAWTTCLFWCLAGMSLIGLLMLICNRCDRLYLHYQERYERKLARKRQPVYRLRYAYDQEPMTHEVRSA